MIDMRHLVRWMMATLAVFIGLALLAAPLPGLRAMPDHEPVGHEHGIIVQGAQFGVICQNAGCSHDGVDHKVCCGNACGFCATGIDTAGAALLDPVAATQHYGLGDRLVSGMTFPPLLGPPRSQA